MKHCLGVYVYPRGNNIKTQTLYDKSTLSLEPIDRRELHVLSDVRHFVK